MIGFPSPVVNDLALPLVSEVTTSVRVFTSAFRVDTLIGLVVVCGVGEDGSAEVFGDVVEGVVGMMPAMYRIPDYFDSTHCTVHKPRNHV